MIVLAWKCKKGSERHMWLDIRDDSRQFKWFLYVSGYRRSLKLQIDRPYMLILLILESFGVKLIDWVPGKNGKIPLEVRCDGPLELFSGCSNYFDEGFLKISLVWKRKEKKTWLLKLIIMSEVIKVSPVI